MKLRGPMIVTLVLALGVAAAACATPPPPEPPYPPQTVEREYDFRDGKHGWEAGFVEYHKDMEMELDSGLRPLPSELGIEGTGFYIQGMNRSDDLFMFLTKHLTTDDGIIPGQEYRVSFRLVLASNAPSGAMGIGGPPGEGVFLKAGATPIRPEPYLDATDYWMLNVDKGGGNSGEGEAATIVGTVENGLPAEEVDFQNLPYVALERFHEHTYTVTANDDRELWLLVGTDSGFEGLTGLYYLQIDVTLEPVA